MYTVFESLPFFKNYSSISDTDFFKRLNDVKDGERAQNLMLKCEGGMSEAEFDAMKDGDDFQRAVSAIEEAETSPNRDRIISSLRCTARLFHRLKNLDGTIPWAMYTERYPCLKHVEMEPEKCRGEMLPCNSVLTRCLGSVVETILMRHEILSKAGGIFADRLLTAIELGVPFHRIKKYQDINLPVAMKVLKEYFPDCSEEWLEHLTETYAKDWEREPEPPNSDETASVR